MLNSHAEVNGWYIQWLSGWSLRTIGRYNNVGRMKVYTSFVRLYGKGACNLRKQSLARVVFQEYGDLTLATKAKDTEGLFRTNRSERHYSGMQGENTALLRLSYPEEPEPPVTLCLPLYRVTSAMTTHFIYLAMWGRTNRSFGADCLPIYLNMDNDTSTSQTKRARVSDRIMGKGERGRPS